MSVLLVLLTLALPLQNPFGSHIQRAPQRKLPPDIVLILADDFGVDMVRAYGEGAAPPCTPNIDALAARGMLFRNAWSSPVCSPARASLLTGRYGFRTGIGEQVAPATAGLSLSETTVPEMLQGYASTCAGKWHLSGNLGNLHPNNSGFGHFAGSLRGELTDYFQWSKVIDGQMSTSTTYATTDTVNEAITAMSAMPHPWFLFVSFNAPHAPFHVPPPSLCPSPACANTWCGNLPPSPTTRDLGKAMTEAMDTEIGRLLAALDAQDPNAMVFFMGDNGTASLVSEAPFLPTHAKDTLYEGGINVPLIVRGPGVAHGECAALVSCTDLFATFAQLAQVPATAQDSVSMVPYFSNPALSLRTRVYAEGFSPNNGTLPFPTHRRAIRDSRYKLIRITGQADELYDLQADPFEASNLLPNLTSQQQQAYDALQAELVAMGVG